MLLNFSYLKSLSFLRQVVEIEFFNDFFDDPLGPAVLLDLQVKSRFVEIYSTTYRIHANFSGLRWTSYFFSILIGIKID